MGNPFVHAELNTTDLGKAKAFYGRLFEWKLEDTTMPEIGTYTFVGVGDGTGGGMMTQMIPGAGSAWTPYVAVDDVEQSTKRAKDLGATLMKDVTEVPERGWFSILTDPTGAIFGLWQSRTR
jgi:uncharacterized protein